MAISSVSRRSVTMSSQFSIRSALVIGGIMERSSPLRRSGSTSRRRRACQGECCLRVAHQGAQPLVAQGVQPLQRPVHFLHLGVQLAVARLHMALPILLIVRGCPHQYSVRAPVCSASSQSVLPAVPRLAGPVPAVWPRGAGWRLGRHNRRTVAWPRALVPCVPPGPRSPVLVLCRWSAGPAVALSSLRLRVPLAVCATCMSG